MSEWKDAMPEREVALLTIDPPEPCRYCARPTYRANENGPLHPCCSFWMRDLGQAVCRGCERWVNALNGSGNETKGGRRRGPTARPAPYKSDSLSNSAPPSSVPSPGELREALKSIVIVDRDVAKAKILVKLQRSNGLWVSETVLSVTEIGGADAPGLLLELVSDGYEIDQRPSPTAPEPQYRIK
jgi:hypothetical protein